MRTTPDTEGTNPQHRTSSVAEASGETTSLTQPVGGQSTVPSHVTAASSGTGNEQQDTPPAVTVICVTYAHEEYIAQTLQSLVSQKTTFPFRVLVGDDRSPDRTPEIVAEYAAAYPHIIVPVLRQENIGSKQNLADLLSRASSPYICFCDGDDYYIDEYKLQKQYDYMESHPTLRGCFARCEISAPDNWYLNDWFKPTVEGRRLIPDSIPGFRIPSGPIGLDQIIGYHPLHTATMFFRWDYSFTIPDWWFSGLLGDIPLAVMQIGDGKMGFLPDVVAVYRRHNTGVHMFKNQNQHFLETRLDYLNYLYGVRRFLGERLLTPSTTAIDARIRKETINYLRAALEQGGGPARLEEAISQLVREHPAAATMTLTGMINIHADYLRMIDAYSWPTYVRMARDARLMKEIAPRLDKMVTRQARVEKARRAKRGKGIDRVRNWISSSYKDALNKVASKPLQIAFDTRTDLVPPRNPSAQSWRELAEEAVGKRVILVGARGFLWEYLNQRAAEVKAPIAFIVDMEPANWGKRVQGIPIVHPSSLAQCEHSEFVVIVLSSWRAHINADVAALEKAGVDSFYTFLSLEESSYKMALAKALILLKRAARLTFHKNGLWRNYVIFNTQGLMRKLRIPRYYQPFAELKQLRGSHAGQRCFIIGTGPSLAVDDVEKLADEVTFGTNAIYRLYDQTSWRPTYYSAIDPNSYRETAKHFRKRGQRGSKPSVIDWGDFAEEYVFLSDRARTNKAFKNAPAAFTSKLRFVPFSYLDQHINSNTHRFKYSDDIVWGSFNARTVVNFCINIAQYMGFTEIYLLGVDCDYSGAAHYFDGSTNMHSVRKTHDRDPGQADVYKQQMQEDGMLASYRFIANEMEKRGVSVFNATRGGKLEVFPRVALEDVVR